MIWWRRLHKAKDDEVESFNDMMREEKVTHKDKFAMTLAAFAVIVLPCLLVLVALSLLCLWLFGAL